MTDHKYLQRMAIAIANNLKSAFGGASQVAPEDLGRAVAGNINNNWLGGCSEEEACVAVVDAFDEDLDDDFINASVKACRASLAHLRGKRYRSQS